MRRPFRDLERRIERRAEEGAADPLLRLRRHPIGQLPGPGKVEPYMSLIYDIQTHDDFLDASVRIVVGASI